MIIPLVFFKSYFYLLCSKPVLCELTLSIFSFWNYNIFTSFLGFLSSFQVFSHSLPCSLSNLCPQFQLLHVYML